MISNFKTVLEHSLCWIEVWTLHWEIIFIGSVCICMQVYVSLTWQGCYWGRLGEIPDSSAAVCLGSLILTPGYTSWLIWSSPSGLGPNQQTQTDTVGTQTQIHFVFCIYICLLTVYNCYYFHKKAQQQGSVGNSQAQFEIFIFRIKGYCV